MQPIIEINNLSKRYDITHRQSGYIALRDVITNVAKKPFSYLKHKAKQALGKETKEEFWALKDINFTVEKGEAVGIIGSNGAGKSTLLKILTGITPPTTGEAILRGNVASLLEVGTGFHPELTGRENIFLNGAILGMSKKEITRKFNDIVEFSGIDKFLDTPVKRYSSGMYVRLAFSVAAHMEPDILLVDEVLAVGDAEFQKKCLGKMDEVTKTAGRTILFVSHNMGAIQNLCKRCIVLEKGKISYIGETNKAINEYLNGNRKYFNTPIKDRKDRKGRGMLRFTDIKIETPDNTNYLVTGKPFKVKLYFDVDKDYDQLKNVAVSFTINDQINGDHILAFWTETTGSNFVIDKNKKYIECDISKCHLVYGQYYINLFCTVNGVVSDYIVNAAEITVDDKEYFSRGIRDHKDHPKYVVDHEWKLN
jgi:lipopolysaccharide transport system ATP-binding protein